MAYRRPAPSIAAAARALTQGDHDQVRKILEQLDSRINDLEIQTNSETMNNQKPSPKAPPPPLAKLSAQAVAGSGRFILTITNPEYLDRGNFSKSPILHRLEASPLADFSADVVSFPIGTQTHYVVPVEQVGGTPGQTLTRTWRLTSSRDGVTFNKAQTTGALTA